MNKLIIGDKEFDVIETDQRQARFLIDDKFYRIDMVWLPVCNKEHKPNYQILEKIGENNIITVRRLSDNKLFNVSDKVKQGTISRFTELRLMVGRGIAVTFEDGSACKLSELEEVECRKEPLFKSWDGVAIFEGDEIWYVGVNYEIDNWPAESIGSNEKGKVFSTYEAANLYVLTYKPCLSIHDINNSVWHVSGVDRKKLEKLVKERLHNDTK